MKPFAKEYLVNIAVNSKRCEGYPVSVIIQGSKGYSVTLVLQVPEIERTCAVLSR